MTRAIRHLLLSTGLLLAGLVAGPASAGPIAAQHWAGTCAPPGACYAQLRGDGIRLLVGWHDAEERLRVGALVPPQVGVQSPVTIWLDDQISIYLQTNSCTERYCEAMVHHERTHDVISLFKNARGGVISYRDAGRVRVAELSLMGFTTALVEIVNRVGRQARAVK